MSNLLKYIFSIQGIKGYTIVRIFGIKITLKKRHKIDVKSIESIDKELLKIASYKMYKENINKTFLPKD